MPGGLGTLLVRTKPGKAARLLALVPLCLLGVMALLALFFAAGPLLGDGESVRTLGVWAGCAFLLLGVPVPLGSVICGACSLWLLKGQRARG